MNCLQFCLLYIGLHRIGSNQLNLVFWKWLCSRRTSLKLTEGNVLDVGILRYWVSFITNTILYFDIIKYHEFLLVSCFAIANDSDHAIVKNIISWESNILKNQQNRCFWKKNWNGISIDFLKLFKPIRFKYIVTCHFISICYAHLKNETFF